MYTSQTQSDSTLEYLQKEYQRHAILFVRANSAPIVLVTAAVKLKRVVDLRDGKVRQRLRISQKKITGCDWRAENNSYREAITQAWGWALHEAGVEGILAPSVAWLNGANLVVFPGNFLKMSELTVLSEVEWPRP